MPLKHQIAAMANFAALPSQLQLRNAETVFTGSPYLSKGESIASSSVRVAMKCGAKMLVVLTDTGKLAGGRVCKVHYYIINTCCVCFWCLRPGT